MLVASAETGDIAQERRVEAVAAEASLRRDARLFPLLLLLCLPPFRTGL